MEIWKESLEFDALAQDVYVVALKHIRRERPDFDPTFLEKSLEEQRKELQGLSVAVGVRLSIPEPNSSASKDPAAP